MKNRKNRVRDGFGTRLGSSIDFGHDFGPIFVDFAKIWGGFWKDFGRISGRFLEGFQVAGLTLMIRATRGRSIDR